MKLGTLIVSTNAFSRSSLGYTVSQLEAAGIRRISLWGGAAHGFSGYPVPLKQTSCASSCGSTGWNSSNLRRRSFPIRSIPQMTAPR